MRYLPAPIAVFPRTFCLTPGYKRMTDRQTDKTTQWAFTAYEQHYDMIDSIINNIKTDINFRKIEYQDEICPDTGRKHRQGLIITFRQHRYAGKTQPPGVMPRPKPNNSLLKLLPGVHIEPAWDWHKLVAYCKKQSTRDLSGGAVTAKSEWKLIQLHDLLTEYGRIYIELTAPKDCPWCELPEHKCLCIRQKPDAESYWVIANLYLRRHPEMCHLVPQPNTVALWKNSRDVWVDRAISITPGPSAIISSPNVSNASCPSRSSRSSSVSSSSGSSSCPETKLVSSSGSGGISHL